MTGRPIADVATFAREHLASKDIDPVYDVLRELQRHMTEEDAVCHSLVYVAYYNLASAQTAWTDASYGLRWLPIPPADHRLWRLPTGTERRNLRGGAPMHRHFTALVELAREYGDLFSWLAGDIVWPVPGGNDWGVSNWDCLDATLQTPWGNGRWASYKSREILWKVNDFPLLAPDTGMANSSGPRQGLAVIEGYEWVAAHDGHQDDATIERLEDAAQLLRTELREDWGVELAIEELETVLCDFHALADGRYYVGHDIDQLLEQVLDERVPAEVQAQMMEARFHALPHEYLGEWDRYYGRGPNRTGVDKARKRVYRDTGGVIVRG